MSMKRIIYLGIWIFMGYVAQAWGVTVHLNSGESLSGRIQKMDEQSLYLESDRGFGILRIDRADMRLIEFDQTKPDLTRKFGLGFYQRGVALNGSGNAQEYSVGSLSARSWFDALDAIEFRMGVSQTEDKQSTLFSILTVDMRIIRVYLQEGNHHLYLSGGGGIINVNDKAVNLNKTGFNINAALGIEVFPLAFPNLGISGEVGVNRQSIGDRTTTAIFNIGPAMSVNYYF